FQSENGWVPAAASNMPCSLARVIISRRRDWMFVRSSLMCLQTRVPTSITDWCISGLTASCSASLALGRISDAMCERRWRVSGSIVGYSSSMPMLRLGRSIWLFLGRSLGRLFGRRRRFRSLLLRLGTRFRRVAAEKRTPAIFRSQAGVLPGFTNRQFRHGVHNPVEIFLAHRVYISIGSGSHEVDGVRDAVFAGEFNRVEVVAQSAAEGQTITLYPLQQLRIGGWRILHIALVERRRRIVVHDVHLLLADHVAAEILFEIHPALQGHAEVAALVVGVKEFLRRVHLVYVFPTAAVEGLQERGKSNVAENAVPRHGILQVAHGALGGTRGMLLVRQQDGLRNRNAQLGSQREVKKFVVGAPPEWIVDNDRAGERHILQVAAIEGNIVRNAVHDNVVGRRLRHTDFADGGEFRLDVRLIHRIDLVDQRGRKGGLHAKNDSDLLHGYSFVSDTNRLGFARSCACGNPRKTAPRRAISLRLL